MLILSKCCRLLHDGFCIKSNGYSKCAKPIPLSLMTHRPFFLCFSAGVKARSLPESHYSTQLLKSHYFGGRMHLANAPIISNHELCFNASCYFRNRGRHLTYCLKSNAQCERESRHETSSRSSNSTMFEFLSRLRRN